MCPWELILKQIDMLYSNIGTTATFSGEIYDDGQRVILIDELVCEAIPYSEVKKELNREFLFCSHKVLTNYIF